MTSHGNETQAQVLSILKNSKSHLTAYDIMAELRVANPKIAPPTVYRALAALCDAGKTHRIESAKAYFACMCDEDHTSSIISICDDCGTIEEAVAPDLISRLTSVIDKSGFSPTHHVVEVHGHCASCDETGA